MVVSTWTWAFAVAPAYVVRWVVGWFLEFTTRVHCGDEGLVSLLGDIVLACYGRGGSSVLDIRG